MIESALYLAGVGVVAYMLVAGLLARRPALVPVALRIRNKKR